MTVQADDVADLLALTFKRVDKGKWTDLTTDTQEHIALPKIMTEEKVSVESGPAIQWKIMKGTSGTARSVALYEPDVYGKDDVFITAEIPWRHLNTNMIIDEHEIDMNRQPDRIINMVKQLRAQALIDLAVLFESFFWSKPATSSDVKTPYGVKCYIVKSTSAPDFNGGNPTGFTSGIAGVNSSTYTRWKNWSGKYVAVSRTDLLRKWREAATKTYFKPPVDIPLNSRGNRYGYYAGYNIIGKLEEELEKQNDNLGNDIASKDGLTVFQRTPVTYVPHLDDDSDDPIYGINWGCFYPCVLRNWWMKEYGPRRLDTHHNVLATDIDCSVNIKCTDRRRQFVLSTANSD